MITKSYTDIIVSMLNISWDSLDVFFNVSFFILDVFSVDCELNFTILIVKFLCYITYPSFKDQRLKTTQNTYMNQSNIVDQ